jgi:LPS-assembly protein
MAAAPVPAGEKGLKQGPPGRWMRNSYSRPLPQETPFPGQSLLPIVMCWRLSFVNRLGFFCRGLFPVLLILFLVRPVSAAELEKLSSGSSPLSLEADQLTFDPATETYRAAGMVRLKRGDLALGADTVRWNAATSEAEAEGHVLVTQPEMTMEGRKIRLNLQTREGEITDGQIFLKDRNFHIAGAEIQKLEDQVFKARQATFTSCDGEPPSWKFSAREVDLTAAGLARAKHVFFYLHDIPVFYTPYLVYPVRLERVSGFLLPDFGYSSKRGVQFSLAYYQVIARNMDATFYLDYLSKLGLGKGLEYRYVFGEDKPGILHAYQINGFGGAKDRYAFDWRHLGTLPGKVHLSADVEYVSSRDYFSNFGQVAGEYNKAFVESVVYLARNWDKVNLSGQVDYIKDLEQSNQETLQRLPEIRLAVIRRRVGQTPLYVKFDTDATYFWRQEGLTGTRLSLLPSLEAAFHPGGVVSIVPQIGYLERLYQSSEGDTEKGGIDFSTRISTRFSRTYSVGGKTISKIQHIIEPEVDYVYFPDVEEEDLPQFNSEDKVGPLNRLSYALVNRFVARLEQGTGVPYYHEFLYLRLAQDYDISESQNDQLFPEDEADPFSALAARVIIRPTRRTFIDLDGRYDLSSEGGGLLSADAWLGLKDEAGNGLAFDYRYTRDQVGYVDGTIDLALLKPLFFNYRQRYDSQGGRTLEKVVNFEYRAQCWSLFFTYRDRLQDQEYLVSFALSGVGRVAKFGGSLGGAGGG